jgi:alpha-glucosidase
MPFIRAAVSSLGLLALAPAGAWAQWTVSSPNGSTSITVNLQASNGTLNCSATQGGAVVIENSPLGISTSAGDFVSGLSFVSRSNRGSSTAPGGSRSSARSPPSSSRASSRT